MSLATCPESSTSQPLSAARTQEEDRPVNVCVNHKQRLTRATHVALRTGQDHAGDVVFSQHVLIARAPEPTPHYAVTTLPAQRCAGQHIHTYMLPMHTLNSLACTHGGMLKDLAIMLSEESNIHAHPQTHVVTPSLHPHVTSCLAKVHHTTPRGFEPLRAEPNGFRVHLLNRSDTVSCREGKKHNAMHHKTLLDPRQQRSDVRPCAQRSEIHSSR